MLVVQSEQENAIQTEVHGYVAPDSLCSSILYEFYTWAGLNRLEIDRHIHIRTYITYAYSICIYNFAFRG